MLCEEWPEGGRYSAETMGSSPVSMSIQVPDVDAFAEHAVAAGAKLQGPIRTSSMDTAREHCSIPLDTRGLCPQ